MEQEKPSLHEIAAMPFPASMFEMRKHYNSAWGKPIPDDGQKRSYKVCVNYEVHSTETRMVTVEAFSEEEACELAENEVADDLDYDEEVTGSEIFGEPS